MKEILVLAIGGFGNKVGVKFWEEMEKDTYQDTNNKEMIQENNNVYYNLKDNNLIPRCLQVDFGQDIPNTPIQFDPCNQFSINQSSGNNYAYAKNNNSVDVIDILMDCIRLEIEQCDKPQGFQIFHSVIGGTGSGLTAKLCEKLNEEYSNLLQQSNVLVPSIHQNDFGVLAPYNTILSLASLYDSIDQFVFYDNEALQINSARIGQAYQSYEALNEQIAQSICCNSSSFRMPGDTNSSLRKLLQNLKPFVNLKITTSSITNNIQSDYFKEYLKIDEGQIIRELMNPKQNQCSSDITHGRLISAAVNIRGKVSNYVLDKETFYYSMFTKFNRYRNAGTNRVQWLEPFFTNICRKSYQNYEMFGSCFINSSSIQESVKGIFDKFDRMHIKKSYMYIFTQEGIEEGEFIDAKARINDYLSEYQNVAELPHVGEGYEGE